MKKPRIQHPVLSPGTPQLTLVPPARYDLEISNLNLPRITDTVTKCELQTVNNIRNTVKLYGAYVNSLPRICAT